MVIYAALRMPFPIQREIERGPTAGLESGRVSQPETETK